MSKPHLTPPPPAGSSWITFATLATRAAAARRWNDVPCQVCRQPADWPCERCGGPIHAECWEATLPPEEARRWAAYVAALNAPRETVTIKARTRRGRVLRWRVPGGPLPVDDVHFAMICPGCQS
jgi:hypothetical protein